MVAKYDEIIEELIATAENENNALSVRLDMIRQIGRIGNKKAIKLLCILARYETNQAILDEVTKSVKEIYNSIEIRKELAEISEPEFSTPEEPDSSIRVRDEYIDTNKKNKIELELLAALVIIMFCLTTMVGTLIIIGQSFQVYPFIAWSILLVVATIAIIKLIKKYHNQK